MAVDCRQRNGRHDGLTQSIDQSRVIAKRASPASCLSRWWRLTWAKRRRRQSPRTSARSSRSTRTGPARRLGEAGNARSPVVTRGYQWARQDSNLGPQPYQGCAL